MIIGKTDIEQDDYDCLVFCSRDVKIPNFIKRINSCAFNLCRNLRQVEIPSDSKHHLKSSHFLHKSLKMAVVLLLFVINLNNLIFKVLHSFKKLAKVH